MPNTMEPKNRSTAIRGGTSGIRQKSTIAKIVLRTPSDSKRSPICRRQSLYCLVVLRSAET